MLSDEIQEVRAAIKVLKRALKQPTAEPHLVGKSTNGYITNHRLYKIVKEVKEKTNIRFGAILKSSLDLLVDAGVEIDRKNPTLNCVSRDLFHLRNYETRLTRHLNFYLNL